MSMDAKKLNAKKLIAKKLRRMKEQLKKETGFVFREYRALCVDDPKYRPEDYLCGQIQALLNLQKDL